MKKTWLKILLLMVMVTLPLHIDNIYVVLLAEWIILSFIFVYVLMTISGKISEKEENE